ACLSKAWPMPPAAEPAPAIASTRIARGHLCLEGGSAGVITLAAGEKENCLADSVYVRCSRLLYKARYASALFCASRDRASASSADSGLAGEEFCSGGS